jgi:nucleoside-diphosphate-sugar epimerase
MTTLVTGANGFIGHRLLTPSSRGMVRHVSTRPNLVCGDLLEPTSLAAACHGCDTIFHCAGYAHAFTSSDPDAHWRINFEGTRNLLLAAKDAGVKTFIYLSSVKAMADPDGDCVDENWPGEPNTQYGKSKRAAEEAVLEAGLKYSMHVVNLRLSMVYGRGGRGNLERMARLIRTGWFPPLPETGNRRSLVHVDDVVSAMHLAADAPFANGRTYIVADSIARSGREIYDAIRACLNENSVPSARESAWQVPSGLLRAGGMLGDVFQVVLRRSLPLNSEAISRLLDSACYRPAKIERELGWRAQMSFHDGLREMLSNEAPT